MLDRYQSRPRSSLFACMAPETTPSCTFEDDFWELLGLRIVCVCLLAQGLHGLCRPPITRAGGSGDQGSAGRIMRGHDLRVRGDQCQWPWLHLATPPFLRKSAMWFRWHLIWCQWPHLSYWNQRQEHQKINRKVPSGKSTLRACVGVCVCACVFVQNLVCPLLSGSFCTERDDQPSIKQVSPTSPTNWTGSLILWFFAMVFIASQPAKDAMDFCWQNMFPMPITLW